MRYEEVIFARHSKDKFRTMENSTNLTIGKSNDEGV